MAVTGSVTSQLSSTFRVATGIATVSLAQVGTEIDAAVLEPADAPDPTKWQSYFATLANSLVVSQADPTKTSINIDQSATAIATSNTAGDFTIAFTVPDVSRTQMALFFTETSWVDTDVNFNVLEVGMDLKVVPRAMRIDLSNGDIVVFGNVELLGALTKTGEDAFSISVTGTVLANDAKEVTFGYKK
jgi:hypothetical protein